MIVKSAFKGSIDFNTETQYRFQPLHKNVLGFRLHNDKLYVLKNMCGKKK